MRKKISHKICVVGCGTWGKNHIRTLNELGALGGVVDSNNNATELIRLSYPSIPTFNCVIDALETNDFKGYVVATPADTHYEIALNIISAGYHVLVEKPVTLKIEEVLHLKKCALENNVNLMAGHVLLFHPAIQKIKELINSGIIGELQYIYSNRLNLGIVRTEENVFWSLAPHDIAIFQYFTETKPKKVISTGGIYLQDRIHDTTLTNLEYENNVNGHIFVSWLHPFKEHRLVVIGSQGMIRFEDSVENNPLQLYAKSYCLEDEIPEKKDGPIDLIEYDQHSPLTEELKYFIQHLDGSPLKLANADNAIEVVEILFHASESLTKGVPVE